MAKTLDFEYLVADELAAAMRAAGLAGFELRQVHSSRDHTTPLPWWQIIALHQLPPWAAETAGYERENQCPLCGRDGHFHSNRRPLELVYYRSQVEPEGLPDIVATYEHFGNGGLREPFEKSHIPHPLLLIKPRVYELFTAHKVRGLEWVPVMLLNL